MLYLCATPIGNMEDITLRVLRVLSEVDAVYAEDTRHSAQLLSHYDIKKPLLSCHEHNEAERSEQIAERLKNGENIAYISDAGMPCISDPGARLISVCIEKGLEFTVLPGASASVTALALSGLNTDRFLFYGFLPRTGKERREALLSVTSSEVTVILYESPNRVGDTLRELCGYAGENRRAALVREITKVFEEARRGTLCELCELYREASPKGECVIVLEGKPHESAKSEDVDDFLRNCLSNGMRAKDAAKLASESLGVAKNEAYKRVLELMQD